MFSRWRRVAPVRFAAGCALVVAVIGLVSDGATFGSGYAQTRGLLEGDTGLSVFYTRCKFIATWLTTWTGVPAGIFAPSLAIGAGIGSDVAVLTGLPMRPGADRTRHGGFPGRRDTGAADRLHHRDGDGGRAMPWC